MIDRIAPDFRSEKSKEHWTLPTPAVRKLWFQLTVNCEDQKGLHPGVKVRRAIGGCRRMLVCLL